LLTGTDVEHVAQLHAAPTRAQLYDLIGVPPLDGVERQTGKSPRFFQIDYSL
jgi:hypothetical protein